MSAQQAALASAADGEDADGDVVMADEDVEQLIVSLHAARHDSKEWEDVAGHPTISMLLYGQQVCHPCCILPRWLRLFPGNISCARRPVYMHTWHCM